MCFLIGPHFLAGLETRGRLFSWGPLVKVSVGQWGEEVEQKQGAASQGQAGQSSSQPAQGQVQQGQLLQQALGQEEQEVEVA